MAEQPSRKRRIVRRAVMALAVVVLLPVGYVTSYWSAAWLSHQGIPPWSAFLTMQDTVWAPLILYAGADLPGGRVVMATAETLYETGGTSVPLTGLK